MDIAKLLIWDLCTAVMFFSTPVYALLEKYLYDSIQTMMGKDKNAIQTGVVALVGCFFAYNFMIFLISKTKDYFMQLVTMKVNSEMHKKVMGILHRMPFEAYEDNKFYNSMDIMIRESNGECLFNVNQNFFSILFGGITLISLVLILSQFSILAVLVSMLCCIPGFLHQSKFGVKNWIFNTTQVPIVRQNTYFFNLLTSKENYKEKCLFAAEPFLYHRFEETQRNYHEALKSFNLKQCWKGILMAVFHSMGTVGVMCYAYIQAATGHLTIAEAILYANVSQNIYNILQNLIYYWQSYIESIRNVEATLKYTEESVDEQQLQKSNEKKPIGIQVEDICFKYPNSTKYAIDHASFHIKPNEKIALVGENGSGKTTLAKLLLGIYNNQSGEIQINDTMQNEYKKKYCYSTACFQNFHTYLLSIRENIGFGNLSHIKDDAYLYQSAQNGGLENVFNEKVTLDTYIQKDFSQEGIYLSGGQLQKLSLARAFASEAGFLVLDEPSASLDIFSENEIFRRSLELMKNKTVLIITHRLSNVLKADRIIYLNNGKIEEIGTHDELMENDRGYAALFRLQADQYLSGI